MKHTKESAGRPNDHYIDLSFVAKLFYFYLNYINSVCG